MIISKDFNQLAYLRGYRLEHYFINDLLGHLNFFRSLSECSSFVYMVEISPFEDVCLYLFSLCSLLVFSGEKLLSLMDSHLTVSFCFLCLEGLTYDALKYFLQQFHSFKFKSKTHFEIVFIAIIFFKKKVYFPSSIYEYPIFQNHLSGEPTLSPVYALDAFLRSHLA